MEVPSWDKLLHVVPTATIALTIAGVGFFAAVWLIRAHIKDLKEFIDFLKGKDKGD